MSGLRWLGYETLNPLLKCLGRQRFDNLIIDAVSRGEFRMVGSQVGRQHDERDFRAFRPDCLEEIDARYVGHVPIGDNERELTPRVQDLIKGLAPADGSDHIAFIQPHLANCRNRNLPRGPWRQALSLAGDMSGLCST